MTIPRDIFCTTPHLDTIGDQGIFRPIVPGSDNLTLEKKSNSPSSWTPSPLYRNVSLLSSPSDDSTDSSNFEDLPADFVPPRHVFSSSDNVRKSYVSLRPKDIVCGRGAQRTSLQQPGNAFLRELVKENETTYIFAKRSDKPRIAQRLLDLIRSRGMRFIKREKRHGRWVWVEIDEQRAYEKVCQALREGAPGLRRRLLASSGVRKATQQQIQLRDQENYSPIPCFM